MRKRARFEAKLRSRIASLPYLYLTDQSGGLLPRGNSRLCGTALSGLRIIGNDASLGGKSPTIVEDADILRAPDWACVTVTQFRLRRRRQEEYAGVANRNLAVVNRDVSRSKAKVFRRVHRPQFQSEEPPILAL